MPETSKPADDTYHFRYGRAGMQIYSAALLAAWGGACIWLPFSNREGWLGAEWVMAAGFVALSVIFFNAWLANSDVHVSSEGISWHLSGWRWREFKWAEVKYVLVSFYWDAERRAIIKKYHIFKTEKARAYFWPDGGMMFNEKIHGVRELEAIVEAQIEWFGIRVERRT